MLGPKILGQATDLIFSGVIGSRIPAGVTKAQAVARLRAQGNSSQADMLSSMHLVPGQGIDFGQLGHVLVVVLAGRCRGPHLREHNRASVRIGQDADRRGRRAGGGAHPAAGAGA